MRQIDVIVCEIVCPSCSRVAAIVSPNDDGTYIIEDYFRGIGVHTTDPVKWRKQTTQWRWRPIDGSDDMTWAYGGVKPVAVAHANRGITCTKSGCKTSGSVLQNDLVAAVLVSNDRVARLPFKSR